MPDRRALGAAMRELRRVMDEPEAGEQHSILVYDPQSGRRHIVGPYRNRLLATVGLELLRASNVHDDPELADLQYEVVLTFAPEVSGA